MNKLIIEDDEGRTTVVPLVRDELSIGRKEGNTIRLTERNVSRRHARLFRQNGAICVEDFASYTGVRVNGIRISNTTPVRDGDQVQIGDYKLSIRSEGVAEALNEALPTTAPVMQAPLLERRPVAGPSGTRSPLSEGERPTAPPRASAPAHMDAAPTIPLRTLQEQGRAPNLDAAQAGRLFVLTTNLAGMEFRLDRASLVIGRTEENDIILNHASISRHHAKVVRDGDRYTVVDLQSANGVRVAGESYERVDVQPGDIVELGHVKLRFVGPWENWTFDPREFAPKSGRKLKIGAAVGGVVMAAVLISALQSHKAPPPAPRPAVVVVQPPAGPSPNALWAEAEGAVAEENWDKAVSALDLLVGRPAGDPAVEALRPGAIELKRRVDFERHSAEVFASFQQAVASKELDAAQSRYDEIPIDSVFKKRAEPALGEMKTGFLATHLDLADSARVEGRCDEARAEADKVRQVDPENLKAGEIVKRCRVRPPVRIAAVSTGPSGPAPGTAPNPAAPRPASAIPAVARPPAASPPVPRPAAPRPARQATAAPAAPRAVVATNTTRDPSSAAAADDGQPDSADLIRQAREAWMHQQCGSAIDLSRRALRLKPSSNDAHQIIAVCACSTKDREGALKSYSKLDERSRAMVRTLCARNGVELIE
jgi:ABC transport system ATP-binding/permease protein